MGFANAAIMDTKDLVFVPEYRTVFAKTICVWKNYNLVPACPPACGTVEENARKSNEVRKKALVLQTVFEKILLWIQFSFLKQAKTCAEYSYRTARQAYAGKPEKDDVSNHECRSI